MLAITPDKIQLTPGMHPLPQLSPESVHEDSDNTGVHDAVGERVCGMCEERPWRNGVRQRTDGRRL
jgi:hypothetical protein